MRCVVDGLVLAGTQNPLFSALVAADSKSAVVGPGRNHAITKHVWYLEWGVSVSQGEAVIETAGHPDYSGAWAPLGTVPFSAAGQVDRFSYDGMLNSTRVRMLQAADGAGVTVRFSGHRG